MFRTFFWCLIFLSLLCRQVASGQEPPRNETQAPASNNQAQRVPQANAYAREPQSNRHVSESSLPKYVFQDQEDFWTAPFQLRPADLTTAVPLLGITSGLVAGDTQIEKTLPKGASFIKRSNTFSNLGVASYAAAAGGFYLLGRFDQDDHMRETGLLSAEAASDALIATEALKFASGRQRPFQADHKGEFWDGGSSFPSAHATAAWSVASIFAHEYPGTLTKMLAYGAASAISAARVTSRNHFSSDAFIGSALGWYMGSRVYRARHDPDLDGAEWGTFDSSDTGEENHDPGNSGSPYVPLDSWIYPAFDRLAALGYAPASFQGIRPWTRLECARLLEEADDPGPSGRKVEPEVAELLISLRAEFAFEQQILDGGEQQQLKLDSIYARSETIAGKPLTDGYHFGKTIINDFGRPYSQGENAITGVSSWALEGPFAFYFRGEYQHAPRVPSLTQPIKDLISKIDLTPVTQSVPSAPTDQFRLLDTYVALNLKNNEFTFGKQSLSWGTGESGGLLFSNNADPIYMARLTRVAPFTLPWIFGYLGPIRTDLFLGRLSGNLFPPRPLLHGEKISFKPTRNLELGFTRTAEFGGVGRPLTIAALVNTYTSVRESDTYHANDNPGKRAAGLDFSYRVPGLRNWLTIYNDSLSSDDPSPLAAPRRAAMNPGVFLPQIPGLRKLSIHGEAVYTDTPATNPVRAGRFIYYDQFYRDYYTNKGDLIGNWIGRDGTGFRAWSTYWFSSKNSVQIGYRDAKIDAKFIPGGGTITDVQGRSDWWINKSISVSGFLQHERWAFPVLASGMQTNITASFEVDFHPNIDLRSH